MIERIREWCLRLWATIRPNRSDGDLEEELRLHLELAAEEGTRRSTIVRVGGVAQAMSELRDQRRLPWLGDLIRDARYGLRALRRTPTFSVVALATVAIGIGATTAVFSVVNGVLLKPLTYPHSEDLVSVWLKAPGAPGLSTISGDLRLSASMFFTFSEQNRTCEQMGVWYPVSATVTGLAEPEQVRALAVSNGTLQALDAAPALGRWLQQIDQEPAAPQTIMLGYGYWQRRFGAARDVIGRAITVDSRQREIVGVMPPGFGLVNVEPDLILPARFDRSTTKLAGFGFQAIARLKPGVTVAQADADFTRMVPTWMASWPAATGVDPRIYERWQIAAALRPLKEDVIGNVASSLWVLLGTVGIVLVIACANVANLLLVRADARQQELAVRAALGAGWGRIVRGLLVESLLLGLGGGLLGVGLADAGLKWLVAIGPPNLPRLHEITIDLRVLSFSLVLSMASGVVFGLIPAIRYAGPRIAAGLRSGGRTSSGSVRRRRARNALVVTQIALAFVLLVSSGLMLRSFQALRKVEPGFADPTQLQTLQISIPEQLELNLERVTHVQQDIADKLATISGVTAVGFASAIPMDGRAPDWDDIDIEGKNYQPGEKVAFRVFKTVSPGFFEAIGTRVVAGRDYTWADLYARRPFAMVSENLARELWGTPEAAVGKRIHTLEGSPWREVIGVVQDTHDTGADSPAPAIVYWPSFGESLYRANALTGTRTITFVIRTSRAGTEALMREIRQAVWSTNASVPLASVQTMQELYEQSMGRTSFTLVMLSIAAAMGLLLGLIGIYGVISYAVSQRTREIGIRLALGANQGALKTMFVRHGLMLAGGGVLAGLSVSAGLTRLISSLLFGVGPLDPATYIAVPVLLTSAAVAASYVPARRAAAVDPVKALKTD